MWCQRAFAVVRGGVHARLRMGVRACACAFAHGRAGVRMRVCVWACGRAHARLRMGVCPWMPVRADMLGGRVSGGRCRQLLGGGGITCLHDRRALPCSYAPHAHVNTASSVLRQLAEACDAYLPPAAREALLAEARRQPGLGAPRATARRSWRQRWGAARSKGRRTRRPSCDWGWRPRWTAIGDGRAVRAEKLRHGWEARAWLGAGQHTPPSASRPLPPVRP